jgi:hypothetical protein
MLRRHEPEHDRAGDDFAERDRLERARRLARHLEALGSTVVPPPASVA